MAAAVVNRRRNQLARLRGPARPRRLERCWCSSARNESRRLQPHRGAFPSPDTCATTFSASWHPLWVGGRCPLRARRRARRPRALVMLNTDHPTATLSPEWRVGRPASLYRANVAELGPSGQVAALSGPSLQNADLAFGVAPRGPEPLVLARAPARAEAYRRLGGRKGGAVRFTGNVLCLDPCDFATAYFCLWAFGTFLGSLRGCCTPAWAPTWQSRVHYPM